MALRNTLALSALALAAGLSVNPAMADDVKSSNPQAIQQWYGRAGGLAGSDRVAGLRTGEQPVSITYDRAVAARTNMSTDRASDAAVGISYDEQVATRTNMQRGSTRSVVATQPDGKQAN
jgi:hypothetical protein